MAIAFFNNFPTISYKNKKVKNILLRAALRDVVRNNASVYLPLTLEDSERTDMIAADMYNNSDYDWIVKFSANVIDPYHDWLMTDEQMKSFIIKKYGSMEAAMTKIIYYKNTINDTIINNDTFTQLSLSEINNYLPVYAYDMEVEKNETKRSVNVISPEFVSAISNELEKKLND